MILFEPVVALRSCAPPLGALGLAHARAHEEHREGDLQRYVDVVNGRKEGAVVQQAGREARAPLAGDELVVGRPLRVSDERRHKATRQDHDAAVRAHDLARRAGAADELLVQKHLGGDYSKNSTSSQLGSRGMPRQEQYKVSSRAQPHTYAYTRLVLTRM